MSNKKNPYESLGISTNANIGEVKKAYRKLALNFHPDKARKKGFDPKYSELKFKEIGEAYELLSDPSRRNTFDRFGWEGADRSSMFSRASPYNNPFYSTTNPFEIFNNFFGIKNRYQSYSSTSDSFFEENDSFDNPFRNINENNLDIIAEINISLQEAYNGKEITLQPNELNLPIRFKIPERSNNRKKFIIRNNGMHDGFRTGDLILVLNINNFHEFTLDGLDLHLQLKLDNKIMSNGGEVRIPFLDNSRILLKIPKKNNVGSMFRIKGKGLNNQDETGNLIIHTIN